MKKLLLLTIGMAVITAAYSQDPLKKKNFIATENFQVRSDTVPNMTEVNAAISTAESNNVEWADTIPDIATQRMLDSLANSVYTELNNKLEDETDPIYVADSSNLARMADIDSLAGSLYDIIQGVETVSRTIYIATTGDDDGDGSSGNPFATYEKAISTIKPTVAVGVVITIDVAAGTYTVNMLTADRYFSEIYWMRGSSFIVSGKTASDVTGLTITASATPYIYDVTGATFTANQYQDYFMYNGSTYYPIVYNGTNTINSVVGATSCTSIVHNTTIFNITAGYFFVNSQINQNGLTFEFQNIDLNYAAGQMIFSSNLLIDIINSKINATQSQVAVANFRTNYKSCAFVLSANNLVVNGPKCQFQNTSIRKSGSKANTALTLNQNYAIYLGIGGMYIYNFATGIACQAGNFPFNLTSSIVFDNITTALTLSNNTTLQISNSCPVYLSSVTTFLNNKETLYENYSVNIGIINGTPTTLVGSGVSANGYCVPTKGINISVPGIYTEFSSQASGTLTDNTTTDIAVGDIAQNKSVKIEYQIIRGTGVRFGTFQIFSDGTNIYSMPDEFGTDSDAEVSAEAIVLSAVLDGTEINLRSTLDNTGNNGTIKYSITRIMQ